MNSQPSRGNVHILVVDDEPEIAESLSELLLRTEGYRITIARDGREAVRRLEASLSDSAAAIDLVLLDVIMPYMSGPEVLDWLRQHPQLQYTRVIMLTAAVGSDKKVAALSAGADDYITKPYSPLELIARVKSILRTQQLEKQLQRQGQQLTILNRVSRDIAAKLTPRDVLAGVVQGAWEALGIELASAFLLSSDKNHLICQEIYPAKDATKAEDFGKVAIDRGIMGQAFRDGESMVLNEFEEGSDFRPGIDAPLALNVRSLLVAPLLVRGGPVGVIVAYNKLDGSFSDVDRGLFGSLVSSGSRALEIAWLFQGNRQRQQELLESRNMLQAVIDGILHPIYTIDERWRLVAINETKIKQLGQSTGKLEGQTCHEVFFNRSEPCDHCLAENTVKEKRSQGWSVSWLGQDHLAQEWEISSFPVPGTTAGAAQAVIVWQDRTEERRLESSLIQAAKLTAIGQLAAGVAHEINNPLTAIQANAEMLQMAIPEQDDVYESVDLIAQAGDRAAKVVRGLLDFARERRYRFENTDVNQSIDQALSLVSYQFKTVEIEVVTQLDGALPSVMASQEHLQTVWVNLLINARDAVQEINRLRKIEIVSRFDKGRGEILVFVRDNGRGMTSAQIAHIFEPFYTTKAPGTGTGLGLATSHQIIQRHGGQIEVVSTPGKGTTFVIRLPVATEAD